MPVAYKGLMIPLSSDLADGPRAFQDYTDSLSASDVIKAILPAGAVISTVAATAPTGWLLLDGTLVVGAQTAWPNLWAIVPVAWRVGADLQLPDARGRVLVGVDPANAVMDAIGEKGGAAAVALAEANLPPHGHAQAGTFPSGGASARHNHGAAGSGQFVETYFGASLQLPGGTGARAATFTSTDTPDHTHSTTISGPTGNGNGTSAPVSVLQPFIAFNWIIKAA